MGQRPRRVDLCPRRSQECWGRHRQSKVTLYIVPTPLFAFVHLPCGISPGWRLGTRLEEYSGQRSKRCIALVLLCFKGHSVA